MEQHEQHDAKKYVNELKNLWLNVQNRLDNRLYNSRRNKFDLERHQQQYVNDICRLDDYSLFQQLGFTISEKSPPSLPISYQNNG